MQRPYKGLNYKLKTDRATNNHTMLLEKLKQYPFNVNVGECTSENNKRVSSILFSLYDEEKERSVVEHSNSIECVVVNAQVLFNSIANLFECDTFRGIMLFQICTIAPNTSEGINLDLKSY